MFDVTQEALRVLRSKAEELSAKDKDPRIFVDSKGCKGFEIGCNFDMPGEGDQFVSIEEFVFLVHANTALLVAGGTLDYDADANDFVFRMSDGSAYTGKFFRKDGWQTLQQIRKIELLAPLLKQ